MLKLKPLIKIRMNYFDSYLSQLNNNNLYVYDAKFGKGLKSKQEFKTGEPILYFHGPIVPLNEAHDLGLALQLNETEFMMSAGDIDDFVNHSCDANTVLCIKSVTINDAAFNGVYVLVAIKNINIDDPVTFDYSISMSHNIWKMENCQCGSSICRNTIKDFNQLPDNVQVYLKLLQNKYSN